jgi:Rrf2 family protein
MKISAKAEYACLAVLALARQDPEGPPVRIREISAAHGIPERYLVQILLQLKGAGLVSSTRGAAGGYRLARPADAISLGEVLTAIDGPEPARRGAGALRPAAQVLAAVWEHVRAAERAVLDQTSIAQLAERTSPREWVI